MDVVDWTELPPDLVDNIAKRLNDYVDYVRLRAVCWKWRSTISPKPQYLATQYPLLMLSPEPESYYGEYHGFFHLLDNKVYRFNMSNDPPWRRCCGSSHGWLVLLEEHGPGIVLFNPITSIRIQLPPLTTFPYVLDYNIDRVGEVCEEYLLHNPLGGNPTRHSLGEMRDTFINKVVLSTSPTSLDQDYVAVAIFDSTRELALCKKGDEGWTKIKDSMFYWDVIYYEGVFCAVHYNGSLTTYNVSGPSLLMKKIDLPSSIYRHGAFTDKLYLVDSFGELLMVYRLFNPVHVIRNGFMVYDTKGFEVVKLNSRRTKWVKVKSLGDRMLFLGTSSSMCLLATDFSGCDANCIYFTGESINLDGESYCNHDSGVFNLGDGSSKELQNCTVNGSPFLPPPVWLMLSPC